MFRPASTAAFFTSYAISVKSERAAMTICDAPARAKDSAIWVPRPLMAPLRTTVLPEMSALRGPMAS